MSSATAKGKSVRTLTRIVGTVLNLRQRANIYIDDEAEVDMDEVDRNEDDSEDDEQQWMDEGEAPEGDYPIGHKHANANQRVRCSRRDGCYGRTNRSKSQKPTHRGRDRRNAWHRKALPRKRAEFTTRRKHRRRAKRTIVEIASPCEY
jgi:hypothetical protein